MVKCKHLKQANMKQKLSIVIMAHPKRKAFIPYLVERLGKDTKVVYDRKNNVWDTCRRAWLAQDRTCEYGVVIQDDAIVCNNFRKRAGKILSSQQGDFIFSFFAGQMMGARINRALKQGKNFVTSGMIFNEVALCMKTEYIDAMVKWCDERNAQTDQEIGRWARMKRLSIFYPIPSLIDHRVGESIYRKVYNKPMPDKQRTAFLYEE